MSLCQGEQEEQKGEQEGEQEGKEGAEFGIREQLMPLQKYNKKVKNKTVNDKLC